MTDIKYWLWLTLAMKQSSRKLTALMEHFENPLEIYRAEPEKLSAEGFGKDIVLALKNKSLAPAEKVMQICRQKGIRILTLDNPHYPTLLANIFDPPLVLYVKCRERIALDEELAIAVVGTRRMTAYGRESAVRLGAQLASAGVTVVSGMARGIDGAALEGALSQNGKTVAVLGCGVDIAYPSEHAGMMQKIAETGLVLSEYPPGTPPLSWHFPIRNRIISGLCLGTVVVESPEAGGSLITAKLALEQGRDVFAVPGNINRKYSGGTNELIRQGAKLTSSALDIISEYKDEYINIFKKAEQTVKSDLAPVLPPEEADEGADPPVRLPKPDNETYRALSENEKKVVDVLSAVPVHVDVLAAKTGLSPQELNTVLTLLEMKGLIRLLAGQHYVLNL